MFGRMTIAAVGVSLALFTAGCGGGDSSTPSTSTTAATTTTTTTTTTPAAQPAAPAVSVPAAEPHGAPHVVPPAAPPAAGGGPVGADGSTGNNLSPEYCAQNQDPGCPVGTYVGPNAIPNPDGTNNYVPCEGTICTNPDHGAGTDPQDNGDTGMENPDGSGDVVPCEGTICTNPNNGAGG